ncbi:MAG: 5'-nucleotidase C-terminal domain-containing protein [Bacteroidetes bacterium]|nr:5'-nucleotidase C-terminal domain-containing protein [Bacteroidota bacterium]
MLIIVVKIKQAQLPMNALLKQLCCLLLSLYLLQSCSHPTKIVKIEKSTLELNSKSETDSVFTYTISPYKNKMDAIMNEVLIVSDQELLKGLPESSLGNFVSDAVLKKTNDKYKPADGKLADICLLNNGGLRAQLPKGTITRGKVFELMPFENSVVVLTLSGEKTKELFDAMVANNGAPFSGATIIAKGKKIKELKIAGADFDINKTYKIVTSDYLSAGGDKYDFFKNPLKTDTVNYLLRDAIIDYLIDENKKGNTLKFAIDGRIKFE